MYCMGQDWGCEWPHHSQIWQHTVILPPRWPGTSTVANNITATSLALGQVEASFIHKHEDVMGLISLKCHSLQQHKKKKKKNQISHTLQLQTITFECSMFSTSSIYYWPLLQWFQTWGTCTPATRGI